MTAPATGDTARRASPPIRAALAAATLLTTVHLASWLPSLTSPAADPVSPCTAQLLLDPNTATADELALLPRIGPKLAQAIVEFRQAAADQPAFRDADDLDRVSRIGPATVARLRPHLRFSAARHAASRQETP